MRGARGLRRRRHGRRGGRPGRGVGLGDRRRRPANGLDDGAADFVFDPARYPTGSTTGGSGRRGTCPTCRGTRAAPSSRSSTDGAVGSTARYVPPASIQQTPAPSRMVAGSASATTPGGQRVVGRRAARRRAVRTCRPDLGDRSAVVRRCRRTGIGSRSPATRPGSAGCASSTLATRDVDRRGSRCARSAHLGRGAARRPPERARGPRRRSSATTRRPGSEPSWRSDRSPAGRRPTSPSLSWSRSSTTARPARASVRRRTGPHDLLGARRADRPVAGRVPAADRLLVVQGWDVLVPDPRGTTGHGRAYQQALRGEWGRRDVDDTAAILRRYHADGHGRPAHTVMMGSSSGGLTVLGCAGQAPRTGGRRRHAVPGRRPLDPRCPRVIGSRRTTRVGLVGPAERRGAVPATLARDLRRGDLDAAPRHAR